MPGLSHKSAQYSHSSSSSPSSGAGSSCNARDGIWSRSRDDVTFAHLHKFWSELSSSARRELLRIDKQALFEQVRKNLYCSRCNGLLLEGFSQIVLYGKSMQQEATSAQVGGGSYRNCSENGSKLIVASVQDDARDPSVHPWGGLATSRDGILTLLDCFLIGTPLEVVQNVFDSARARERERELLYPDACGGGGRGWISQGCSNSGRGHGMKETCALHTARLSCGALVDFWSALGEETRLSLLRMKEEDFIERLMFRFDSKRFCRDCRRNVLREFKELKELKRMRREPRCTSWFCVADTAFQYEVSDSTVQADWHECFAEAGEMYQHFEWAVGTGEGKSDILGFEDVGLCGSVQADGLDLGNITACFITLRAWKHDGRCTELSVKAHALEGRLCVHRRLIVGDGYVTITKGESIKRFFEHAEEAEEEEDEDSTDKEGNDLDSEGSRPQKHAKSPELARDFLLDAATVIFKEQVEKAFREGTARQNAHSIFVCLALGLLEERVHVACKEIITLEKQNKLLEEEAAEKREEEERKERKRLKEREKKLRRKEKLKGKEREKEKNIGELKPASNVTLGSANVTSPNAQEEQVFHSDTGDPMHMNDDTILARPPSPDMIMARSSRDGALLETRNDKDHGKPFTIGDMEGELNTRDGNGAFIVGQSKSAKRKSKLRKSPMLDTASIRILRRGPNMSIETNGHVRSSDRVASHGYVETTARSLHGMQKQSKNMLKSDNPIKGDNRSNTAKCNEKLHWPNGRSHHRYDYQPCACSPQSAHKTIRDSKIADRSDSTEVFKPFYWIGSHTSGSVLDNCGVSKGKNPAGMVSGTKGELHHPKKVWEGELHHPKKVWEPLEARQQANKNPSQSKFLINSTVSKEAAASEKEGTTDGSTIPCTSGNTQDSNNSNDFPIVSSSKNRWSASDSFVNHENERNSSISNLHHVESDARHSGLFPESYSQVMNVVSGEQAAVSSFCSAVPSASHLSESTSCFAATTDSSTLISDHNSCTIRPSSNIISKKVKGIPNTGASCFASENGCQYRGEGISSKSETALHVPCSNHGNTQVFDNEEVSSRCPGVSSPVSDILIDNFQTKGPSISLANGSSLSATKSTLPTVEVTPQPHILPMQIPSMSSSMFPLHPPHNQGYYQSRAWSAVSANGLLPFPQPNRFLFPGPAGFGLSPSRLPGFSLPYPSLQSLPPAVPVCQVPPFPHRPNSVKFKELSKPSTSGEREIGVARFSPGANLPQQEIEHSPKKQGSDCPSSSELSSPQLDGSSGNSPTHDISGFSLFHFGGPAAVMTKEHDSTSNPLKEESLGELFSSSKESCVAPLPENDPMMPKEQVPVEEYSLFAASHGNRFGFF